MKYLSMILAAVALVAGVGQASAEYARSALHLRDGPGSHYRSIVVIPYCGQVTLYSNNGYGWCDVAYQSYRGWAACSYLVSYCGGGGGYGYRGGGGYSGGGGGSYGGY